MSRFCWFFAIDTLPRFRLVTGGMGFASGAAAIPCKSLSTLPLETPPQDSVGHRAFSGEQPDSLSRETGASGLAMR
jgi:hypothetical protein